MLPRDHIANYTSLSKYENRSFIHQGAGMEARNNIQNMVKLLVERFVLLSEQLS